MTDMIKLKTLCTKIVQSLSKASYPNTLSIARKLDDDNFNLYMFTKVLSQTILETKAYYLYEHVKDLRETINMMTNKRCYFEEFLTKIWIQARS